MSLIESYTAAIDRDSVTERISDLESEVTVWAVTRRKNGSVIERFSNEDDASDYIAEEDYDTDKVFAEETTDTDSDEYRELTALREFDQEALSTVDDWRYGTTLISADQVDDDYAKQRAIDQGDLRAAQLDDFPFNFIDWEAAAEDLSDSAESVDYSEGYGSRYTFLAL